MKSARYLFAGAVLVALVVGLGFWKPTHLKADGDGTPKFRVDPFWPKPYPAPVGYNPYTWPTTGTFPYTAPSPYALGTISAISTSPQPTPSNYNTTANRWVPGEVASTCVDADDNVYTFNRAWEVGVVVNGTTENAQSGGIAGTDGTDNHSLPSPPVLQFDPKGNVIAGWGNPALNYVGPRTPYTGYPTLTGSLGRSAYMPNGAHGCFVDYQGYVWVGGNVDGIVQQYNPVAAKAAGASATAVWQIGTKDFCDAPNGTCSETTDYNSSWVLLNYPPDIAVDPAVGPISGCKGDVYVADGYGNHRVVVFNPCKINTTPGPSYNPYGYIGQWGSACATNLGLNGTYSPTNQCPANEFGASGGGHPHCVVLGDDDLVYLCDRPNARILVINKTSTYIKPSTGAGCTVITTPPATGTPGTPCTAPTAALPLRVIPVGYDYTGTPSASTTFPAYTPGVQSVLWGDLRACDMDLYINHDTDYLKNEKPSKYIIEIEEAPGNGFLLDKATGNVLSAIGRCGFSTCNGRNPGEFAYSHTLAADTKGNVYVSETTTGRRIQKFVPKEKE